MSRSTIAFCSLCLREIKPGDAVILKTAEIASSLRESPDGWVEIVRNHISFHIFFHTAASVKRWIPQDVLPLQSMLVLGSILILLLALAFHKPYQSAQLLAATTLHPITATIAGFLLAGAVGSRRRVCGGGT